MAAYSKCWLYIQCIELISYKNITFIANSIRKWYTILENRLSSFKVMNENLHTMFPKNFHSDHVLLCLVYLLFSLFMA